MKKLLTFLIAMSILGLVSCEKDDPSEIPGNIPGLGDARGKPEIKEKFVLPEGISIEGAITGFENMTQKASSLKSRSDLKWPVYGSGSDVMLKLTLKNESRLPRTIFLPKGLIWENTSGDYQHGLQIQTTWISLKPGDTKQVTIRLYCANLNLPIPDQNGIYTILGVTSSKIIWGFLDLIGWKIVNYEMIENPSDLKSPSGPSFDEITIRMQQIIEKLTDNGQPISDADKQFIQSIPDVIDEDVRAVLNRDPQYPDYLQEYSELVKK